jgi:hypothetical protein
MPVAEIEMSKLAPISNRQRVVSVLRAVSSLKDDKNVESIVVRQSNLPIAKSVLQAIEAAPDGIFSVSGGNKFEAVANVFFIVNYSTTSNAASISESIPAHIEGHFEGDDTAVIDEIKLDADRSQTAP